MRGSASVFCCDDLFFKACNAVSAYREIQFPNEMNRSKSNIQIILTNFRMPNKDKWSKTCIIRNVYSIIEVHCIILWEYRFLLIYKQLLLIIK